MSIPSKAVGVLSLASCITDIHKSSMLKSQRASQKAAANTFIATDIGCQKNTYLSYKDTKRKNWLVQNNFLAGPAEFFAGIGGYLDGVKDGFVRYAPNIILSALAIIPGKKHKLIANISAGALAALEGYDFIANGTDAFERTNYLE